MCWFGLQGSTLHKSGSNIQLANMRCKDTIMTANLMPSTNISHPSIITRRSSSSSTSIGSSSRRTKMRLEVAKKQSSWHSKLSPNKWKTIQEIRIYAFYRVIPSYKFILYIQLLEINVTNEWGLKSRSIVYTRPCLDGPGFDGATLKGHRNKRATNQTLWK